MGRKAGKKRKQSGVRGEKWANHLGGHLKLVELLEGQKKEPKSQVGIYKQKKREVFPPRMTLAQ